MSVSNEVQQKDIPWAFEEFTVYGKEEIVTVITKP
jgi:hypothetical protein